MENVNLDDLRPVVNFASTDAADVGEQWGPRSIPDYQLFYVVRGTAELTIGGEVIRLLPGEAGLYGPSHSHLLQALERTEYISLHFLWDGVSPVPVHPAYGIREESAASLEPLVGAVRITCLDRGDITLPYKLSAVGVETVLLQIVKEYRNDLPGYPSALRALLTELLLQLVRPLLPENAPARATRVEAALHAIREHPERPWTVAELAALCGYHPSYFTQVFLKEMGSRPKDFLISERINQARQALLRGDLLESIVERLGYGSVHYFSNHFKKETGLSPSQYRQRPDRATK